jgi:mannose-1-phosphate guanylyltransferase
MKTGRRGAKGTRYAVVMAGGSGTRFWPHSRRRRPKQFLSVAGESSLLQETVERLRGLVAPERILVVTAPEVAGLVRRQLPSLPRENLVLEPSARGTAPCLALSAACIGEREPGAAMAVFPADHVIRQRRAFHRAVRCAFEAAERQRCLVTFGIPPTQPETGYGYIRVGARRGGARPRLYWASRFVEKPDAAKARRYLASGEYLWNSGMFVWRVDVLRAALRSFAPNIAAALWAKDEDNARPRDWRRRYRALESQSIDVAVMEKADRVAVVEGDFLWSDVGSWDAMATLWPTDARGNACRGDVLQIDCSNTVVHADKHLIAMLGVDDLVVVESADALLICRRSRAQDVRRLVDALARDGRSGLV